jgi:hypothetical protein
VPDTFTPRRFRVAVTILPPIPLVSTGAVDLARELTVRTPLTDIHVGDEVWTYTQKSQTEHEPRGLIRLQAKENEIEVLHRFPGTRLERFETLLGQVYESFKGSIAPQFVFAIEVDLTYTFDLKGDSRRALLTELGLIIDSDDPDRMRAFGRPCFKVGLHLGFPPYELIDDDEEDDERDSAVPDVSSGEAPTPQELGVDPQTPQEDEVAPKVEWLANVTIMTMPEDQTKVSVQIEGSWHGPQSWDNIHEAVVARLNETDSFLKTRVYKFLQHFQKTDEDENEV